VDEHRATPVEIIAARFREAPEHPISRGFRGRQSCGNGHVPAGDGRERAA
jgi:hypothetical protein